MRHSVKHRATVALELVACPRFRLMQLQKFTFDASSRLHAAHSGKVYGVLEVIGFAWVKLHYVTSVAIVYFEKCFHKDCNT